MHPLENYPYWERRIGRPLAGYGAFGENFTTTGMVEPEVVVGDVYRVGTSLLQVSQSRTPCFKLAARYAVKELAGWFAQTGLTGFYLRLLGPGEFGAGDAVELLDRPSHGVTVLETPPRSRSRRGVPRTSCSLTTRGCPRAEHLDSQKAAGHFCGPAIVLPGGPDFHPLFPRQLVNPKDASPEYIRGPARADAAFS